MLRHIHISKGSGQLTRLDSEVSRGLLPGSTSSTSTFETINSWIGECLTTHSKCNAAGPARLANVQYPIRMLDLQHNDIVLRDNYPPQNYACLSHCWGTGAEIVMTTLDTIAAFKKNIPWHILPKSFQDAVDISRKLRISYLWIDSLCIIQDSPQDWKEQASQMADIYENAFVTIAATKAQGPSQGCYSQTDPLFLAEPLPGYNRLVIRRRLPSLKVPCWPYEGVPPILTRGWTYQELYLSPRVLHFTSQEVMWECHSMQRCESKCHERTQGLPDRRFVEDDDELRMQWCERVEAYSPLQLTFVKDRLPAIAAIAKRMQDVRGDSEYLAGLWRDTLLLDLLWYIEAPEKDRLLEGSVPTWSWASIPGQVLWAFTDTPLKVVEVLDTVYVTNGPRLTGDILEAKITLRAPLLKMEGLRTVRDVHFEDHPELITKRGQDSTSPPSSNSPVDTLESIIVLSFKWDLIPSLHPPPSECYILPLASWAIEVPHGGLVITRQEGVANTYRRIGFVSMQHVTEVILSKRSNSVAHTPGNVSTQQSMSRFIEALNEDDRRYEIIEQSRIELDGALEGLPTEKFVLI